MIWQQTKDGHVFDLQNPRAEDIRIKEITHSLAIINRYNGHTRVPFSVAQHSVNCARWAKKLGYSSTTQQACLIHDFAEAFIGDITSPMKRLIQGLEDIESRITEAIEIKYMGCTLHKTLREKVKYVDTCMLLAERRDLLAPPPQPWFPGEDRFELPDWDVTSSQSGFFPATRWQGHRANLLRMFEYLFSVNYDIGEE